MHDAISKSLIIFKSSLHIQDSIKGNPISLYYQEDMDFDETGNTLLWYKGLGEVGIVDVKTLKELRIVNNAIHGSIVRKLAVFKDFRRVVSLNLEDTKDPKTRGRIYLTYTDLEKKKIIFSKQYQKLTSKKTKRSDYF